MYVALTAEKYLLYLLSLETVAYIHPICGKGAILGGILAVGGATAWVAKKSLDLEDIKRGQHREVAYLYDIQKLIS